MAGASFTTEKLADRPDRSPRKGPKSPQGAPQVPQTAPRPGRKPLQRGCRLIVDPELLPAVGAHSPSDALLDFHPGASVSVTDFVVESKVALGFPEAKTIAKEYGGTSVPGNAYAELFVVQRAKRLADISERKADRVDEQEVEQLVKEATEDDDESDLSEAEDLKESLTTSFLWKIFTSPWIIVA